MSRKYNKREMARVSSALEEYCTKKSYHSRKKIDEDLLNIDEYKTALEQAGIDVVDVELEKPNGHKIRMVVPQKQMLNFSKSDWNKLFRGVV